MPGKFCVIRWKASVAELKGVREDILGRQMAEIISEESASASAGESAPSDSISDNKVEALEEDGLDRSGYHYAHGQQYYKDGR